MKKFNINDMDTVKREVRFEVFDKNTKKKALEVLEFFNKYIITFTRTVKRTDYYYDTPESELEKSGICLHKYLDGRSAQLVMNSEQKNEHGKYLSQISKKKCTIEISAKDSPIKHPEFLRDSLRDLLNTTFEFDTDFFFKDLRIYYTINTVSSEYKIIGGTGLKARFIFDDDEYYNAKTRRKNVGYFLTAQLLSSESTAEDFDDLISKLSKFCKELERTENSKIIYVKKLTKELPKLDKTALKERLKDEKSR